MMHQPLSTISEVHLRLPAEKFYWAVLDASMISNRRRLPHQQLGYLFEHLLPLCIDDVHAVYKRIDHERILACAMERTSLEKYITPTLLTLCPDSLPSFVPHTDFNVDQLNLLTGEFAPAALRTAYRKLFWQSLAALLMVTLLIIIGIERRVSMLNHQSEATRNAITSIYDEVLGQPSSTNQHQPRSVQFVAELRRLQQTRGTDQSTSAIASLHDVTIDLADLLSHWPSTLHLQTESLALTPSAITVRAEVPIDEVATAIDHLDAWGNWQRRQPELSNQEESSLMTIRYSRSQTEAGP